MASVLVTRPVHQSQGLAELLEGAGFIPRLMPMMDIVPVGEGSEHWHKLVNQVENLEQFTDLVFVSTNAVDHGMAMIDSRWPQLPVGINWVAIGTATARALEKFGIKASSGDGMNSESLLALPRFQQLEGHKIGIVRGAGGRELMQRMFAERGAQVDSLEVYTREVPEYEPGYLSGMLKRGDIDILSVFSGETLAALVSLAGQDRCLASLVSLPILVPGDRVAGIARDEGFNQVIVSPVASSEVMVKTLQQWAAER